MWERENCGPAANHCDLGFLGGAAAAGLVMLVVLLVIVGAEVGRARAVRRTW